MLFNKKYTVSVLAAFVLLVFNSLPALSCEPHWIAGIYDRGELLQLEDSSLWKVAPICTFQCHTWEVGENVVLCDGETRMRNVDRDKDKQEWIKVTRLNPFRKFNVEQINIDFTEKKK